ncbi:hypothetical protein IGI04_023492 [Brassica rapa subsp. trilocularis]|uniref:Uncharacterized protein n=1 Tax=Brassica rapa subsp. trilocularis TaxID=1813537 RepID=A0ABQ7M3Z9_BRACM|nr:hypothetical protein IGI04_023492 [Brassica rapa subsp. trilocularis]
MRIQKRTQRRTSPYVASGSKPRRVLLVFVVKSQRKLRLRRNEKRFDEDSKENPKEDLSEALQVATWRPSGVRARSLRSHRAVCVLSRYVATERVRARSLRSDRAACACSVATDRAVCVLGRYAATEQRVRARSLRSDQAVCVLGRYIATKPCNRFVVFPFSVINLGVFQRFLGEQVLSFRNVFGKRVLVKPLRIEISFVRKRNRELVLVLFLWRKVATKFSILLNNTAFALEKTVDLISSLRKSAAIITRDHKSFGHKGCQRRILSLKSCPSCFSPRTPYILAPRSVYAFTFLPLSRHSIKWRYSIFSDFRNYLQNSVFICGNLTFVFPCEPSMGLESCLRPLWAVFRLETFIATSFDKEWTFRCFYPQSLIDDLEWRKT